MIYYLSRVYASCYKSLYLYYSTSFHSQETLAPMGYRYPTTFAKPKTSQNGKKKTFL